MTSIYAPGDIVDLLDPIGEGWSATRFDAALVLEVPRRSLVANDTDLVIAPVSYRTDMLTDFDVRLPATVRGVEAHVEVWNQRTVLASDLSEARVRLEPELMSVVYAVHNAYIGAQEFPESIEDFVGTPIEVSSDPRIEYQRERIELCDSLSRKAFLALEAREQQDGSEVWLTQIVLPSEQSDAAYTFNRLEPAATMARELLYGLWGDAIRRSSARKSWVVSVVVSTSNYCPSNVQTTGEYVAASGAV